MLHLSVDTITDGKTVESQRLDYKAGWNPEDVIHTITAFANDFHSEGGGYLILGIEEENGMPKRPAIGLPEGKIDSYQKEYLNLINRIHPSYTPSLSIEKLDNKSVIVIRCHQGEARPYDCPVSLSKQKGERAHYIRKGSNTVKVRSQTDKARLEALRHYIPFDERRCHVAGLEVIDLDIILEYLEKINSPLLRDADLIKNKYKLLQCLELSCYPNEQKAIKNAAVLMFCRKPHLHFKAAKVDIVSMKGKGMTSQLEKQITGPVHKIIEATLQYFNSQVISILTEKTETGNISIRYRNYPYPALREIISNALYHQGYDQHRCIEIQIHEERVEVTSYPGPLPPVSSSDLLDERVVARDYRNVKIGELLKDYGLTEKRATGIPTIRATLRDNGSPEPQFQMDDENRTYFKATLHIHPKFLPDSPLVGDIVSEILDNDEQIILECCLDSAVDFDSLKRKIGGNEELSTTIEQLVSKKMLEISDGKYKTTDFGRNKLYTSY